MEKLRGGTLKFQKRQEKRINNDQGFVDLAHEEKVGVDILEFETSMKSAKGGGRGGGLAFAPEEEKKNRISSNLIKKGGSIRFTRTR